MLCSAGLPRRCSDTELFRKEFAIIGGYAVRGAGQKLLEPDTPVRRRSPLAPFGLNH